MSQTPSIPILRRQLHELLTDDIAAALSALREILPETAGKHALVLALQGRLRDANKERVRNTLSSDEYQRRIDTIRAEFLDMLSELEAADFEAPAAGGAKGSTARHGSVLYRVPQRMPLRKPSICTVRVAIDEDAILEDIVLDDSVRMRQRVEVSDMMRAELIDPEGEVFSIRPLNEAEQLVRQEGYTQWLFGVTPREEGEHQLLVKISMMEYNAQLGRYVPRDVSVLETVTIVTETAHPSDIDDAPFKSTGDRFAMGPEPVSGDSRSVEPAPALPEQAHDARPQPATLPRGARAMALFLVFLLAGSSATWALTPPPTRDWWVASLRDSAEGYEQYKEKYRNDPAAAANVEKATYYKADKTGALADLRAYQREYQDGRFSKPVAEKIQTLEVGAIASLRAQPDTVRIMQFVQDFPKSERLSELRQALGARTELLPTLERAYVASIQAQPSAPKVAAFLRDFPQSEHLDAVSAAAATRPAVLQAVQPNLEDAYLMRLEPAPTAQQAEAFLQRFPVPLRRERFETILAKKPALAQQFLPRLQKAAAEQKPRFTAANDRYPAPNSDTIYKNSSPALETSDLPRSGLEMVTVAGGTFTIGCQDGRDRVCGSDEKPAHSVTVSGFRIGKYEITQADWRGVMGSAPPALGFPGCDDCPVETVSWDDVQDFLKKLNAKDPGKNYRLPTEAEWEYACRGGPKSKGYQYAGSNDPDKVAWYGDNSANKTHPVGGKAPNELGLYDMSGNVYEWCSDWYGNYPAEAQSNPKGPISGVHRVLRGGGWGYTAFRCRVANRTRSDPADHSRYLGFRLAALLQ